MKQTVFRFGLLSGLVIILLSAGSFLLTAKTRDYDTQEIIGYLTIFISMIFVFIGIKYYRDRVNKGNLSFGEGLKVGLLIVLIPSLFLGLFGLLYTEVINPSWSDDYYSYYAASLKTRLTEMEYARALEKMEKQRILVEHPIGQFLVMFATVFIIGFIVSIISALSLRKKAS